MIWNRLRNRRVAVAAPNPAATSLWRRAWQMLLATLPAVAVIGLLQAAGYLERLEWLAGDVLEQRDAALQKIVPDLHFVVFDQRSLEEGAAKFGLSWPWPRETYGLLLQYLRRSGARLIFLDFLYTEPSLYGVADDRILAAALKDAGNVYLPVVARVYGPDHMLPRLLAERPDTLLKPALGPNTQVIQNESLSLPVPSILAGAAGCGEANFIQDADGVARRLQPLLAVKGGFLPALGLTPLLRRESGRIGLDAGRLRIGARSWPLDRDGRLVLRFPGRWQQYPSASAIDVVASNVALSEGRPPAIVPETFKNKVVVIGSTAEGLFDLRKTPLDPKTPGFFITAAAWAAGETGLAYDERWRPVLVWPLLLLLATLGAVWGCQPFLRGFSGFALTLGAFLGVVAALLFTRGLMLPVAAPGLGLFAGYGLSLGFNYDRERRQKRFIQGAFAQVLSQSVLAGLVRDPRRLSVGGELAELTVYFSDLVGFTALSERLTPHQLVEVLNLYLGEMIDTIVDEQDGYVDKFIGDAVMAFWGAPLPDPEHAVRACFSALRNQERLQALQGLLQALGLEQPLQMRIGIHTGPAVVGMMGSPKKLNYTVMGDTVNLASRLESANKQLGTQILISGDTMSRVQGRVVAREVDRIRVKGKTRPTAVYELIGLPGRVPETWLRCLEAYQQASDLYFRREFQAALACCEAALQIRPEDRPAHILRERCRQYLRQPPAPDWDGVTALTSK